MYSACIDFFKLKMKSLDIAVRELSLAMAQPSWVMSRYTMLYKYGKRTRDLFIYLFIYFSGEW